MIESGSQPSTSSTPPHSCGTSNTRRFKRSSKSAIASTACRLLSARLSSPPARPTRWSAGNLPGDIDIVAWKDTLLCIIEVKTRTAHDMTPAEVAVDSHKRSILRRLARRYMQQLPQASGSPPELPQVRFDVISVYLLPGEKPEITHFENAFGWKEFRRDWE